MVYECAKMADYMMRAEVNGDNAEAHRLDERLGFLTPILKGFLTEAGKEAADLGIQVLQGVFPYASFGDKDREAHLFYTIELDLE